MIPIPSISSEFSCNNRITKSPPRRVEVRLWHYCRPNPSIPFPPISRYHTWMAMSFVNKSRKRLIHTLYSPVILTSGRTQDRTFTTRSISVALIINKKPVELDCRHHRVWVEGQEVELTAREIFLMDRNYHLHLPGRCRWRGEPGSNHRHCLGRRPLVGGPHMTLNVFYIGVGELQRNAYWTGKIGIYFTWLRLTALSWVARSHLRSPTNTRQNWLNLGSAPATGCVKSWEIQ